MTKKKNCPYFYKKKPKPLSPEDKLKLLALYAWGIDEIQKYWCVRQGIAYDIRNRIKNSIGTVPYSKSKVLVSEVMKEFHTSIEEQALLLKPLVHQSNNNAAIVDKDGAVYLKISEAGAK